MTNKQPSHSGERPVADAAPDSGEKPFDPSHFGRHQFPDGLREELIRAEKPRIDPKFLQDTVPPNRKPVLTEAEQPATTPRGGFAAPKTAPSVIDRDAPTLIAAPAAKPVENIHDRDATTLIKVPTVKAAPRVATSKAADSPSAPPVDTSRTDPTIILPGVRAKNDKRPLVVGVVAALLVLLIIGLVVRPKPVTEPASGFQPKTAKISPKAGETGNPVAPTAASAAHLSAPTDDSPGTALIVQPSGTARSKEKPHIVKPSPTTGEPKPAAPSTPKPMPAPNAAGKQPWIDGL